ncbi:hypothetical protein RND81_01G210000 [Saponaria officinalis]|uniref:Defensin-like protein n=1 Tax=Saponaria officinalis TaxID=3572 RepID=A0AAW1NHD7_SAPOF
MAVNFYLTLIFFFVISGNMVSRTVGNGAICSFGAGDCESAIDCKNRCQYLQIGGQGTCDGSSTPQCMCFFYCPSPPPPPLQPCTAGYGSCTDCDAKCKTKFPSPNTYGTCENYITTTGCLCHFLC